MFPAASAHPHPNFRGVPSRAKALCKPINNGNRTEWTTSFPGLFLFELGRPNSKRKSPGNEVAEWSPIRNGNWTSCRTIQGVIGRVISNRPCATRSADLKLRARLPLNCTTPGGTTRSPNTN